MTPPQMEKGPAGVDLFGILYATEIGEQALSINAICRAAGLPNHAVEVNKFCKLARYVYLKAVRSVAEARNA